MSTPLHSLNTENPDGISENHHMHNIGHSDSSQTVTKERLIKLISVRLKEAALDSPTFRASANYQNRQVDQIDQWIEGLLKTLKKFPTQFSDFKDVNSVVLGQLIPDFLKNSVVDQDITITVIQEAKMSLESLWGLRLSDLNIHDSEITELLTQFSKKDLKMFKDTKKNFEYIQGKYDSFLGKFVAQSKTREPSALREDAFQLYDVRQSYLAASFDFCIEISRFHQQLDSMLMEFTQLIFKGKSTYDAAYSLKLKSWTEAESKSIKSLLEDMKQSRKQIEKTTVMQQEPSRDLKDHNIALIDPVLLTEPQHGDVSSSEKHGWLYMKTTVGKPARQVWVRRWVFVKNTIFGLLSLSPSKTFVQETDKIGVLLANVRYAPDEDRRYCFEVKTIDCTIVFQAESLKDLKSWLTVFHKEKERAIKAPDCETSKYAFGRYPPLFYEFASTSLTSMDMELTSSRTENSNSDDTHTNITSSYLSSLVDGSDEQEFQFSTSVNCEFREPDLNPPMLTARSKLALISHAFLDPTVVPSAVTANIWGSVNWGIYYMNASNSKMNGYFDILGFSKNNLTSVNRQRNYPSYYPLNLRSYDIQLKSLFESSIDPEELVVAHFSCLWSLSQNQELSGRCFLTTKCSYFFLNSTGFVSLLKKPLADLVAVDVMTEKSWEVLKIYDIDGLSMKGRLFFGDGKLLQKKLDVLINNEARSKPKPQSDIIPLMESMSVYEDPKKASDATAVAQNDHSKKLNELSSFQPYTGVSSSGGSMRTNYQGEYVLTEVATFRAPAKAVFHILFGDHSALVRDAMSLVDTDEFNISPWYQEGDKLSRVMDFKVELSRQRFSLRGPKEAMSNRAIQTVEEFVDTKYYRVDEVRGSFEVFGGGMFRANQKIIIIETDAKSCKALFYGKVIFMKGGNNPLITKFFRKVSSNFHTSEVETVVKRVKECVDGLGAHGQVIKAIRTYGNLSQSEVDHRPKDTVVFHLTIRLLLNYYLRYWLFALTSVILNTGHYTSDLIARFITTITMHKVLTMFLLLSVGFNLFLAGRSTVTYWRSRNSTNLIKRFSQRFMTNQLGRSISLNDLDILQSFDFNTTSACFKKFITSTNDQEISLGYDHQIRETRHQIAIKRNDLLVELKILEKIEMELVAGNYRSFVLSELNKCKISLGEMNVKNDFLDQYCDSCIMDYQQMASDLLL